jgi:DNA polymerase III subunit gamma/tau
MIKVRQSFYTKYRPSTFEEIVGQEESVTLFRNSVLKDKHPSAWLVHGPFGLGKTTVCRVYAKSLLCDNKDEQGNPCNACESCESVDNDCNPNYSEIDAGTNSGVKEIQLVLDSSRNLPVNNKKYKIIAIDECHALSSQAEIKLLKPIEEGVSHLIFVLITTHPDKLGDAFKSRLFKVPIKSQSLESVVKVLSNVVSKEGAECSEEVLLSIARKSRGHFRDSLNILEQYLSCSELENQDFILQDSQSIVKVADLIIKLPSDIEGALGIYQSLCSSMSSKNIWEKMLEVLNNSIRFKHLSSSFFSDDEKGKYKEIEKVLTEKNIYGVYDFLLKQTSSFISYGPLEQLLFMLHAYLKNRVVYSVDEHVEENSNGFVDSHYKKSYSRKTKSKAEESVPLEEFKSELSKNM